MTTRRSFLSAVGAVLAGLFGGKPMAVRFAGVVSMKGIPTITGVLARVGHRFQVQDDDDPHVMQLGVVPGIGTLVRHAGDCRVNSPEGERRKSTCFYLSLVHEFISVRSGTLLPDNGCVPTHITVETSDISASPRVHYEVLFIKPSETIQMPTEQPHV